MANPEVLLEEIVFDDYNSDGYLDIKIPYMTKGAAEIIDTVLLQNPDTGRFEPQDKKTPGN